MRRAIKLASCVFAVAFCMILIPSEGFAKDGNENAIVQAETQDEFNELKGEPNGDTEITVNKNNGEVEGSSNGDNFKEVFGEKTLNKSKIEGVADAIENTGLYDVTEETASECTVVPKYSSKRIIVMGEIDDLHGASNGVTYNGETVLNFETEKDTKKAVDELREELTDADVLVDYPVTLEYQSWGAEFMNLASKRRLLKTNRKGKAVTVAVIDTGVNKNHNIFKNTKFSSKSKSFVQKGASPFVDKSPVKSGHGTAVAGIIAESTPDNVQIMSLRVTDNNGRIGSLYDAYTAVVYAARNGADVVNISLGTRITDQKTFRYWNNHFTTAVKSYGKNKMVVVSSSGNNNSCADNGGSFPSSATSVIAVSAINKNNTRATYSNYGKCIEFCAPGTDIVCATNIKGKYQKSTGTSFSSPHVAAAAAMIKQENKNATVSQVRTKLRKISKDYGTKGKDKYYGYGMPKFAFYMRYATPKVSIKTHKYNRYIAKHHLSWGRVSGNVKYQIKFQRGSKKAKARYFTTSRTGATLVASTSKKCSYISVRAYKKINGKTYYSSWNTKYVAPTL